MIKRRICGALLLLILVVLIAGCTSDYEEPTEGRINDTQVVPVEVMPAERGDLVIQRQKGARLTAGREAMVIPAMPGQVTEVLVSVGQHVEKDQVLLRLSDDAVQRQIDQAQAAYNSAQAGVALSKQNLAELESQKADAQQALDEYNDDVDTKKVEKQLKQINQAIADLNTAMKNSSITGMTRDVYDVSYSELNAAREQLTALLTQEAMLKQVDHLSLDRYVQAQVVNLLQDLQQQFGLTASSHPEFLSTNLLRNI